MAFFQLMVKAQKLKYRRLRYQEEKLASIQLSRGAKVKLSIWQRVRRKKLQLRGKARDCLSRLTCWPEESPLGRLLRGLKSPGSLENYVATSVLGFLLGVLLTYLFFLFFVLQLRFAVVTATVLCSLLGLLLSLGLAFSARARCLVLLFLPQFFTRRGRQAMMAYAFILTLTGPAKNTLYNIGALSESLACGQQLLKETLRAVLDLVKQPFYALRDSLAKTVKSIKAVVKRIKQTLVALKRLVLGILRIVESVFEWLGSVVRICNKKFGTPYERCTRVFESAEVDCRAKLGSVLAHLCNLTYLPRTVCLALKPLDLVCSLVSYVSDSIVALVRAKLKAFAREMKLIFYVKIKFSHSFHFETNKSQSIGQIASNISGEIKDKTRRFFSLIDWVSLLTSLFFLVLCLRVIYYRYKWLSSDRFDNRYISGLMREIDAKRARLDKETIFPLNRREREKYTALGSLLLVRAERRRLGRTVVFLATSSSKLAVYMLVDYCLYWLLDTISRHGQRMRAAKRPTFAGQVRVRGRGFLADVYRSLARSFAPQLSDSELEGVPCLPAPKRPDYDAYLQIGLLVLLCWLVAFFEPYGLRLRHLVLNHYYPERARQRAVWLYNRILRSRGSFLKFARRQLRRRFGIGGPVVEKVGLRERLWAVFPILQRLWPVNERAVCLLCGEPERDKSAPHVRCPTPGCVGTYCAHCFRDLRRVCTVCMSPLDYGDLSDFSEERDSSDDQVDLTHLKKLHLDKHSYSYQDDESEISPFPRKAKFKDVEAQTICDDVTMQIFDLSMSESSDSDRRVSCFDVIARKEVSRDTDSTSIADTESWPTEEVSNENGRTPPMSLESHEENRQAVGAVELDFGEEKYSDDELLFDRGRERKKPRKTGLKSILPSIGKIFPFIRKKEKKKDKDIRLKCMNKCQCSSAMNRDGEFQQLRHRGGSDGSKSVSRRNLSCSCRSSSRSKAKSRSRRSNRQSTRESQLEPFPTQEIPKHLRRACSNTKYYEINESNSSWYSPRDAFEFRFDASEQSDSSECSVDSDLSRDGCSGSFNESHDSSCTFTSGTMDRSKFDAQSQSTNPSLYDVIVETSDDTSVSENVAETPKVIRPSVEESSSESESSPNASVSSEVPRNASKSNFVTDESSSVDVGSILHCPIITSEPVGRMDFSGVGDQASSCAMDRASTSDDVDSHPGLAGSSSSNSMSTIQLKDRIREDSD